MRLLHVVLGCLLAGITGCSEYELTPIGWMPGEPSDSVDVLLVLDNSCSMMDDWSTVAYGLTRVPEDFAAQYDDWRVVLVSADFTDPLEVVIGPTAGDEDLGWSTMDALAIVHENGRVGEQGMGAALAHAPALRDVHTVIAFVSDEPDQSAPDDEPMSAEEWDARWPLMWEPYVVAIVGEPGCGEPGSGYTEIMNRFISVCTSERWSLAEP